MRTELRLEQNNFMKAIKNDIKSEILRDVAASEKRMDNKIVQLSKEVKQLETDITGVNKRISQMDENLTRGLEAIMARLENSGNFT